MSNSRVHELAHAIRYADATLSPDDINHWIADALDLLNSGRAGGSSRVYTLPAAFPNRKLTRELERRLEGVENLAAAAIRERDEARGEVERLRNEITSLVLEKASAYGVEMFREHNCFYGGAALDECPTLAAALEAEARVSTPVREERGE